MNKKFFDIAFEEAQEAYKLDEVPIGAVNVKNGNVIAKAHNLKETMKNVTGHAEMLAIVEASKFLDNWRLENCDLYVTLDPCPMCASAIKQARIANVYSALENLNSENSFIINKIFSESDINSSLKFFSNLMTERAKLLLKDFFKNRR